MDKYYTPKIEEFYIGFEFEISLMSTGGLDIVDFSKDPIQVDHISKPNNKIWEKTKVFFDTSYGFKNKLFRSIEQLKGILDDGNIRVKYLDKEDIESLGFNYDETSTDKQWKFFKNNVCLFYRPDTKELGTFTIDPSKNEFMVKYVTDNKMISFLIIKNKSELRKLLKQLNIQ